VRNHSDAGDYASKVESPQVCEPEVTNVTDLGQIHNREAVVLAGIGVDRRDSMDEDLIAIRRVLVAGNRVAPLV
jgi:hypothetical protein